jgi:hypothetical protein
LYSLANKKCETLGILTNYKEWYFTKYSVLDEFKNVKKYHNGPILINNPPKPTHFEVSKVYKLCDDKYCIDEVQLSAIINIIQWLVHVCKVKS